MSDEQREAAGQWFAKAKSDWKSVVLLCSHKFATVLLPILKDQDIN